MSEQLLEEFANPFRTPCPKHWGIPYTEAGVVSDRIDMLKGFTVAQLCAALLVPGLQASVRKVIDRRLRQFPVTTIQFQDQGQDFTQWDVTADLVVDCKPSQSTIWFAARILSRPAEGKLVRAQMRTGDLITIKYPVVKITEYRGAK